MDPKLDSEQVARVPRLMHKGFVGLDVSGQVGEWLGGRMADWMTN